MTIVDVENIQPVGRDTGHGHESEPLLSDHPVIVRKEEDKPASYFGGVFNLSCTVVGAGIMSLPAAVKEVGIIPGVLLIVVSGFLTKYSIDLLLRFSNDGRAYSYAQLMEDAFGRVGEMLYQICVVVSIGGTIVIYLIIIGLMWFLDQLQVESTTQVFWRSGLENNGGQAASFCLFF